MKSKITILTQYYPPETGAPQNRLSDLAMRLQQEGHIVTVVTALPNYPKNSIFDGYTGKLFMQEEVNGINILRCWIFVNKSRGVLSRLLNYFSFVFTSLFCGLFKLSKQDYILCESPPLFLGITGYLLSKAIGAKFIFNISDLWPESAEKLGIVANKTILRLAERLELWLYSKAYLITGQTQGIVENIQLRTKHKKVFWLPNGVSPELFNLSFKDDTWRKKNGFATEDFILNYVGIIGHAQGLEILIAVAAMLRHHQQIKFVIAGDGPELSMLKTLVENENLQNVFFTGALDKNSALEVVFNSNAAIIPLRRIDLFKGAIPSKIFENLALQKPILLGVDGEARNLFINTAKAGIYFEPENTSELMAGILNLYNNPQLCFEFGVNGKNYVKSNFSRDAIAVKFMRQLI